MAENTIDQAATLLNRALETLDRWRHLPDYQLERRVDIFFGLLLPDILKAKFKLRNNRMTVIPEFPLHKGLIVNADDEDGEDNLSVKVDFAVFHPDSEERRVFLVELKTDNQSIHKKQLKRMKKAKDAGAETLLMGVICCARHGKSIARKYAHLMRRLDQLRCIEDFEGFSNKNWKRRQPGLAGRFRNMRVGKSWSDAIIELVLVYPGGKPSSDSSRKKIDWAKSRTWLRTIEFSDVEDNLGEHPFAPFLHSWADCEAGRENPWNNCARSCSGKNSRQPDS